MREHSGGLADIDREVEAYEAAAAATPPDHPDRAGIMSLLGHALRIRYDRSVEPADLDRAIEAYEAAAAATPPDHPDRAGYLSDVGAALHMRFKRTGITADLDRAVVASEAAVGNTAPGHPDRAGRLFNFSAALLHRFERKATAADLDRAVEAAQAAVAATPADHPDLARFQSNLGASLRVRYERFGELADLDGAIDMGLAAMTATPRGHTARAGRLSNLGIALQARYERVGQLDDLARAVEAGEAALAATPPNHPQRATYLSNFGLTLYSRYKRLGALGDLNRAIEASEAAVAANAPEHPDNALYLSNLGGELQHRFERLGLVADLDRAVEAGEAAVAATPLDHPDRARYLSNLGGALQRRFKRLGLVADLDRAVEAGEAAVAATSPDSQDRANRLSNLGSALHNRFERTRTLADLNRAVAVGEAAVAATPPDHPDRAVLLFNLGVCLQARSERTRVGADLDDAVVKFRAAVAVETSPPSVRAGAARAWGQIAAAGQHWSAAVEGYEAAIGLLARLAPRSLDRSDQEYWLGELAGLAAQAAACCLQAGQVDRAVELWEQGRGVILGQALDARTDLTALWEQHPQLATEFRQLRDELDVRAESRLAAPAGRLPMSAMAFGRDQAGGNPTTMSSQVDRWRKLADSFDSLVAHIRNLPGFDRFLLPRSASDLLRAASEGPVILLNVSDLRSDALMLTASGVQVVPLASLTPQAVREKVQTFLYALDEAQRVDATPEERDRAEERLIQILGWLWDVVTDPVLNALGITEAPHEAHVAEGWPRLWWVPSGLLTLLPLQAAGDHTTRFDPIPRTVLDRVVSSYTPTVRTLTHARRTDTAGIERRASPFGRHSGAELAAERVDHVMVVSMPHTPQNSELPGTIDEAALLHRLFPGKVILLHGPLPPDDAAKLATLTGGQESADATFERVCAVLPRCRWAHFACHATSDPINPSASGLLLADHQIRPLTVLDLARLRLDKGELAFLSACATARTAPRLVDEAIHLAAALQLVGFRHVLATLWEIGDRPAVRIATDVYTTLAIHGAEAAAWAMHLATGRRRNLDPDRPSSWAAHIHNGP
jgi:tetratricopeptide (TPR) repeat protein